MVGTHVLLCECVALAEHFECIDVTRALLSYHLHLAKVASPDYLSHLKV